MTSQTPQITLTKLANIWSSRQARHIPVRIVYKTSKTNGCKLYEIQTVEELEKKAA
jgi:hypothetical protein